MTKPRWQQEAEEREREEAKGRLCKRLQAGDTVYTILKHVSSNGMSRRIDLYTIKDNTPIYLSRDAATVLGLKMSPNHEGIVVGGVGMDMGFHLVYELSSRLFTKAGTDGREYGDGYALSHRWM